MGAVFNCEKLKAKNDAQALNEGRKLIADCRHEYGHGGYTGTFAECSGVKIINKPTSEEMCEWYSFEYFAYAPLRYVPFPYRLPARIVSPFL